MTDYEKKTKKQWKDYQKDYSPDITDTEIIITPGLPTLLRCKNKGDIKTFELTSE